MAHRRIGFKTHEADSLGQGFGSKLLKAVRNRRKMFFESASIALPISIHLVGCTNLLGATQNAPMLIRNRCGFALVRQCCLREPRFTTQGHLPHVDQDVDRPRAKNAQELLHIRSLVSQRENLGHVARYFPVDCQSIAESSPRTPCGSLVAFTLHCPFRPGERGRSFILSCLRSRKKGGRASRERALWVYRIPPNQRKSDL